jgi:tetratricopeptide (TPR) repeat protein
MNCAKLALVFGLLIVDAAALQASNPIKLVRQPFSNGEAIKLNM